MGPLRATQGDAALTCLHQGLLLLHHVGAKAEVVVVNPIQALGGESSMSCRAAPPGQEQTPTYLPTSRG